MDLNIEMCHKMFCHWKQYGKKFKRTIFCQTSDARDVKLRPEKWSPFYKRHFHIIFLKGNICIN